MIYPLVSARPSSVHLLPDSASHARKAVGRARKAFDAWPSVAARVASRPWWTSWRGRWGPGCRARSPGWWCSRRRKGGRGEGGRVEGDGGHQHPQHMHQTHNQQENPENKKIKSAWKQKQNRAPQCILLLERSIEGRAVQTSLKHKKLLL